jgi:uncharacterized protein
LPGWERWALGALCAWLVGLSKTGLPQIGILVVPLMVIAVGNARESAGWLLPILCMGDVFAVTYWRRHASAWRLFALAPWVLVGIAGGALALSLPERKLRWMVGGIIVVMLAAYLWRRFARDASKVDGPAAFYGLSAGFATTVANAAGPVMNLYLLRNPLPKEEFVATGAWFFFLVNLTKAPIYLWHGLFTRESLMFDAMMAPAVIAGAMSGGWLIRRIPQRLFEGSVVILTAAATVMLFR